ncbi:hypothetical protein LINGRAHAP2_LOCUS35925 [Linum grandiflorum]
MQKCAKNYCTREDVISRDAPGRVGEGVRTLAEIAIPARIVNVLGLVDYHQMSYSSG